MLLKSNACTGCPLYGDGRGFVPDRIVPNAEVTILAQAPGADEEQGRRVVGWAGKQPVYEKCDPQPLIGKTGWELNRFLQVVGLERDAVSLCNVIKCRAIVNGKRVNELPKGKALDQAVEHCTRAHLRIPESTRLVVASGAVAWKAMDGPGTVSEWRGFLKP